MRKKLFLGVVLSLLVSAIGFAQDGLGVDYFYTKEYSLAKDFFEKQISKSQDLGNAYYYLGEIALIDGKTNEAKENFEKGLAADPNCMLNNVGLGELLLKSDVKAAEEYFSTASKKNKKDMLVIVSTAYAYFNNGMKDKALEKAAEARKVNKKSPYVYVLEGDMFFAEKDAGAAATQYAQAMAFDPKNVIAYVRLASVYENSATGSEAAIEELTKAISISPNYAPAYKKLGKMYSTTGDYAQSISMYQQYVNKGVPMAEDYANYAGAYFFSKENDKAKEILAQGIVKYPNDFYLNRILMYVSVDTEDYATAISAGDKFFAADKGRASYLVDDYLKYGIALNKEKRAEEAITQFEKAIELDSQNLFAYREASMAAGSANKPREAAAFYATYLELIGDKAQALDYFYLGRHYYNAGTPAARSLADSTFVITPEEKEQGLKDLASADAAFAKVEELTPESFFGSYWRARAVSALDPTTQKGLAQPYYLETESRILAEITKDTTKTVATYKNELKESYRYLAYYSYLQFEKTKSVEDKAQIKLYSEKLLQIDPNDPTGKQLFDFSK